MADGYDNENGRLDERLFVPVGVSEAKLPETIGLRAVAERGFARLVLDVQPWPDGQGRKHAIVARAKGHDELLEIFPPTGLVVVIRERRGEGLAVLVGIGDDLAYGPPVHGGAAQTVIDKRWGAVGEGFPAV